VSQIVQPKLGLVGWSRWAWRQLTSMRTALLLLLLLAIAAMPGSVLPQRRIDPGRVQTYFEQHRTLAPWLDRIGGFDVYASAWFSAIYLLLFISLVGCVLPRSRQHAAATRARPPRTPSRLDRMPAHLRIESGLDPDQALAVAREVLRGNRFRIAEYQDEHGAGRGPGGRSLAGERGHLAETGNLAFHLALLGVLVAVAAGSMFGWSGQAIVVSGGNFANVLTSYASFHGGTRVDSGDLPPFALTLDDLQVRFEHQAGGSQFGAPRDFRGTVTVRQTPQAQPRRTVLRVNQPLTLDGARVFLVGNGYAARVTVRNGSGEVAYTGAVPMLVTDGMYTSTGAIKVPDGLSSQVGFAALLLPTAAQRDGRPISAFPDADNPRLLLRAWSGDLGLDGGVPQSVYVLDTSRMTPVTQDGRPIGAMLAPGQTATLPGDLGSITFEGVTRYAALDIRYDPSKGWALGSALLALLGLVLSLFVRRRRVWVRVLPAGEEQQGGRQGCVIELAGLARRDDPRLEPEIAALARTIDPGAAERPGTGEDETSRDESVRTAAAQAGE
jgi:cytochrome c biogenesis protein